MKSFTDIEQSKKLAEILPIDSADMYWLNWHIDLTESKYEVFVVDKSDKYIDFFNSYTVAVENKEIIPCWSLATLLNLLPSVITRNGKRMFLTLEKAGAYNLYYKSPDRLDELWETKEDAIDACVEMILKLNE